MTILCINCTESGRLCTQQDRAGPTSVVTSKVVKSNGSRIKVRVTRLESVVEKLARRLDLPTPPQDKSSGATPSANGNGSEGEAEREVNPPLFALFQNEVVSLNSIHKPRFNLSNCKS